MSEEDAQESSFNPIDPDKVVDKPGLVTYPHHVGSALIRPEDKGKIKARALEAMTEQTNSKLQQIHEQIELLAKQAREVKNRMDISEMIYQADLGFEPLLYHTYHVYVKSDEKTLLSMLSPEEWGKSCPHTFVASVKLLSDYTWEVMEKNPDLNLSEVSEDND